MLRTELANQMRTRAIAAFLLATIMHVFLAIGILFYPKEREPVTKDQNVSVVWVKDVPKPELKRREQLKPPTEPKFKSRILARDAEKKLSKASPNELTEVIKKSERIEYRNVEMQKAEEAKITPWIMTDARIADAEGSNISRVISARGPIDGDGEVTGRVRVRGHGTDGLSLIDSYGTGTEDGMSGGGGTGMGINDQLGLIDFLKEKSGPQQVVYCLDISASMSAAGLKKLALAIDAIRDSMLMLDENDQFNIVAFANTTDRMSDNMLPATPRNVENAFKYLRKFTPAKTKTNVGTDLLGVIEVALQFNPSVIMLVTDGQPTPAPSSKRRVVTNREEIIRTVKARNANRASIYTVGLEMTLNVSPGAKLLVALANNSGGKFRIIEGKELLRFE